jgi:hypothetical protein
VCILTFIFRSSYAYADSLLNCVHYIILSSLPLCLYSFNYVRTLLCFKFVPCCVDSLLYCVYSVFYVFIWYFLCIFGSLVSTFCQYSASNYCVFQFSFFGCKYTTLRVYSAFTVITLLIANAHLCVNFIMKELSTFMIA